MAVQQGYGKMAGTDALVFAYDTGDAVNSYKGKPATNHLKFINQQYTPVVEDYFRLSNGSHEVNVPTLGTRTVKYVDIWNDYSNGSGRCCLSLFGFGTGITSVSPNTTYMYQIVYKTDTGYSHPNYMYRYEYGASGYIKEGGLHSTGRRTPLGDGWYHAWGSFTTDVNTTYLNTYLFHYEYATQNKVQVAQVMLTEGSEVIPPRQFIDFEQTRSATEGLLDLTGNSTVDLTNANYNSAAQIDLDGSNDSFEIGTHVANQGNVGSIEVVFKADDSHRGAMVGWGDLGTSNWGTFEIGPSTGGYPDEYLSYVNVDSGGQNTSMMLRDSSGSSYKLSDNNYHHVIVVIDGVANSIYVDGEPQPVTFQVGSATDQKFIRAANITNVRIGNSTYNGGHIPFDGQIPVVKFYNKGLTAAEVKSNFNNYKTRFNIA